MTRCRSIDPPSLPHCLVLQQVVPSRLQIGQDYRGGPNWERFNSCRVVRGIGLLKVDLLLTS